jgi:hypothetical protein
MFTLGHGKRWAGHWLLQKMVKGIGARRDVQDGEEEMAKEMFKVRKGSVRRDGESKDAQLL